MCHAADATLPDSAAPVATVTSAPLTLTSTDGTHFAGYLARPGSGGELGVLLLPDNRGLSRFYEELSVRLAGHGYPTVAVDYFGRTAGLDYPAREPAFADITEVLPHLRALRMEQLHADFEAGTVALSDCRAVVVLGFCVGGRFAFQAATERFGFAGAIGLYGFPGDLNGRPGPTRQAEAITAPVLALWGGADPGIPPSTVDEFDAALTRAGVPHEFVTYPDAPHAFFEAGLPEYAEAQADSWRRILAFLEERRRAH